MGIDDFLHNGKVAVELGHDPSRGHLFTHGRETDNIRQQNGPLIGIPTQGGRDFCPTSTYPLTRVKVALQTDTSSRLRDSFIELEIFDGDGSLGADASEHLQIFNGKTARCGAGIHLHE